MGFGDFVKSQFIDVIEHVDDSNKLLVYKYDRYRDEIKQGARLIVREGQAAAFIYKGKLTDVFDPGSFQLDTNNLPVLSSLGAVPSLFNSPIKSDLYFINTTQFIGNKFGTKNPILLRDSELGVVRIKAFGTYSFKVNDVKTFFREIFGARKLNLTYDIIMYLNSFVAEAFAETLADRDIPVIELASSYRKFGKQIVEKVNEKAHELGLVITDITIENISLPEEVERIVDEQSSIALANKDMDAYTQFHTVRAMRDAAQQEGGLAGLGAGIAFAGKIGNATNDSLEGKKDVTEKLREYKTLLDEEIITKEEFDTLKKQLLKL